MLDRSMQSSACSPSEPSRPIDIGSKFPSTIASESSTKDCTCGRSICSSVRYMNDRKTNSTMSKLSGTPNFSMDASRLAHEVRQSDRYSLRSVMMYSCRKSMVILAPCSEISVGSSLEVTDSTACMDASRKRYGLYMHSSAIILDGLHSSASYRYIILGMASSHSESKNSYTLLSNNRSFSFGSWWSSRTSSLYSIKSPRSPLYRRRYARTKALMKPSRSLRQSGGLMWSREVMTILNNLCTQALMNICCGCESGSSKYAKASATDFNAGCTWRKASEAVNFLTASQLSPSIRVVNALMTSCMMVWQQAEQSNLGNFLTNSLSMKNQKESRSHRLLSEKSSPRSRLAAASVRIDLRKTTRYLMSLQSMDSPKASSTTSSPNLEKNIVNFDSSSTTASELRRVPSTPSSAQLCSNSMSFRLDMLKLCVILICSSVRVLTSRRMKTLVSVLIPSSFSAMLERRVRSVSNCWLVSPQACLQDSMREPQLKPVESHLARSVVLMSTSSFQKLRVRSSSKANALGALAVKYLCFKVSYIYNLAQPNQTLNPIIPILRTHHCGNSPLSNLSVIDFVLLLKFFSQTARQEWLATTQLMWFLAHSCRHCSQLLACCVISDSTPSSRWLAALTLRLRQTFSSISSTTPHRVAQRSHAQASRLLTCILRPKRNYSYSFTKVF